MCSNVVKQEVSRRLIDRDYSHGGKTAAESCYTKEAETRAIEQVTQCNSATQRKLTAFLASRKRLPQFSGICDLNELALRLISSNHFYYYIDSRYYPIMLVLREENLTGVNINNTRGVIGSIQRLSGFFS